MLPVSYRLKRLDEAPPGGFDCFVSETGFRWAHEPSFQRLAEKVFEHLKANSLDATTAFDRIQKDTVARLLRTNETRWLEAYTPEVDRLHRSFIGYAFGARAYVEIQVRLARGESIFVDSAVAEQRAATCAGCSKNVKETRTPGAAIAADAALRVSLGERSTKIDAALGRCSVCTCQLRAAVHFSDEVIRAGTAESQIPSFPQHCWKRRLKTSQ